MLLTRTHARHMCVLPCTCSSVEVISRSSKPCPTGCGWDIAKDKGCNHMTCKKCGHKFCWRCLQERPRESDAHDCQVMLPLMRCPANARERDAGACKACDRIGVRRLGSLSFARVWDLGARCMSLMAACL